VHTRRIAKSLAWVVALSVCSFVGFVPAIRKMCGAECDKLTVRPNVILITISSLRADHVGCFGYQRDTTPNFDAFCKQGVLFVKAFASSGWMMPAHGSIFTSLYPSLHGATHINKSLGEQNYTLAEVLAENGYYCVGFCCNPRLNGEKGYAQGFDLYDDYSVSMILDSLAFEYAERIDLNKKRTNDLINDAAIRWLQNNTHMPFFMFLHYYDPHWDYLPPPPYDRLYDLDYDGPIDGTGIAREPLFSNPPEPRDIAHMIALYDGEVRQTDDDFGELLCFLRQERLLDNSIVIVMGDHGEQFYEHGHTSHHGVFEELIHIPLAIWTPGSGEEGKQVGALVSQLDMLPTILDYLEIPVPETCQGTTLRPLIEGREDSVHDFVLAEYTGGAAPDSYSLRSVSYKYCEEAGKQFGYDLKSDPKEQRKIMPPDFCVELKALEEQFHNLRGGSLADIVDPVSADAILEGPRLPEKRQTQSVLPGR